MATLDVVKLLNIPNIFFCRLNHYRPLLFAERSKVSLDSRREWSPSS